MIKSRELKSGTVVYDVRLRNPNDPDKEIWRTFRTKKEARAHEAAERRPAIGAHGSTRATATVPSPTSPPNGWSPTRPSAPIPSPLMNRPFASTW